MPETIRTYKSRIFFFLSIFFGVSYIYIWKKNYIVLQFFLIKLILQSYLKEEQWIREKGGIIHQEVKPQILFLRLQRFP